MGIWTGTMKSLGGTLSGIWNIPDLRSFLVIAQWSFTFHVVDGFHSQKYVYEKYLLEYTSSTFLRKISLSLEELMPVALSQ